MNRRFFLKGCLAVSALAITPAIDLNAYPVLYANGIDDDTDAIQAMFDLKPYIVDGQLITGQTEATLKNVEVKTSKTIFIRGGNVIISDVTWRCRTNKDACVIVFEGESDNCVIRDCNFLWTSEPPSSDDYTINHCYLTGEYINTKRIEGKS